MHHLRRPLTGTAFSAAIVLERRLTIQKLPKGLRQWQYPRPGLPKKQKSMTHPTLTTTGKESFFNGLLTDHIAELHGGKDREVVGMGPMVRFDELD